MATAAVADAAVVIALEEDVPREGGAGWEEGTSAPEPGCEFGGGVPVDETVEAAETCDCSFGGVETVQSAMAAAVGAEEGAAATAGATRGRAVVEAAPGVGARPGGSEGSATKCAS